MEGLHCNTFSFTTHKSTDYLGVRVIPAVIADASPAPVEAHLHRTLAVMETVHQSQLAIGAVGTLRCEEETNYYEMSIVLIIQGIDVAVLCPYYSCGVWNSHEVVMETCYSRNLSGVLNSHTVVMVVLSFLFKEFICGGCHGNHDDATSQGGIFLIWGVVTVVI